MKRGRLLALEGLDGSGKSTQAGLLVAALRAAGHDVVQTREPTDLPSGRRIREMALSGRALPPEQELRWFLEDRRAHVEQRIAPALAAGRVVVTDRYFLSTVAYQGARGLDWHAILETSEAWFPAPDLVVLLEIAIGAGLERARARGRAMETVFEDHGFLERVAAIFAAIERPYLERIDASSPPEAVGRAIAACVRRRLGLLGPPG